MDHAAVRRRLPPAAPTGLGALRRVLRRRRARRRAVRRAHRRLLRRRVDVPHGAPTPRRSPSSRSSTGCARPAPSCSTCSGRRPTSLARRGRRAARRVPRNGWTAAVSGWVAGPRRRAHFRHERAGPARRAVADADLLGPLDGRGVERAVPHEPGQGPDRAVDRLRPADADRLRPRLADGQRRGRQGRRAGRPPRPHAHAARRHPAGPDEHVDDDQRHRRRGCWRCTSPTPRSRARRRRRCAARRRTTSSRSTCRAARTSSRPSRRGG